MVFVWVFIIGVLFGIALITIGKKIMSLSHFHISIGFHNEKAKEIESRHQKQITE